MAYAIELLNGGTLHCGFWQYPIAKADRDEVPDDDFPYSQPLNAKRKPPLVFETERDAEVAVEFYNTLYAESHIDARVKHVSAEPTHRLTNEGFRAVEMGAGTLFG